MYESITPAMRCIYTAWNLANSGDKQVSALLNRHPESHDLLRMGEDIVKNPNRSQTTQRIWAAVIAQRLEE